jgi:hypothetical protein
MSERGADAVEEISMKRVMIVVAILILGAVAARPLLAQADSPFIGTWKLNVEKSKSDNVPLAKSLTRTITADGSGLKYAYEGVAADGSAISYSFSSNFDGKASAVTGSGMPGGADSITLKRVDAHKTAATLTKGGKEIAKSEAEVSKDGKVATVRAKGKTADGKDFSTSSVFDKQ